MFFVNWEYVYRAQKKCFVSRQIFRILELKYTFDLPRISNSRYEYYHNWRGKRCEEYKTKEIQGCQLHDITFSTRSQLLLWFHGGGLVLGNARDECGLARAMNLTKWKFVSRKGRRLQISNCLHVC